MNHPFFYASDDAITEAFGPDAWLQDPRKSPGIGNDVDSIICETLRGALATGDDLLIGTTLSKYAIAYLEALAEHHGLEYDPIIQEID